MESLDRSVMTLNDSEGHGTLLHIIFHFYTHFTRRGRGTAEAVPLPFSSGLATLPSVGAVP